jgi:hypothetical protein
MIGYSENIASRESIAYNFEDDLPGFMKKV